MLLGRHSGGCRTYTNKRDIDVLVATCANVTGWRILVRRPYPHPSRTVYALTTYLSLQDASDRDLLEYLALSADDSLSPSDQDLIREAWAELYRRHAEFLYSILMYSVAGQLIVGREGEQAIKDLVVDTFRKVQGDAAASYDPARGKVRTWLCQIAKNLMRDHNRRTERTRRFGQVIYLPSNKLAELPNGDSVENNGLDYTSKLTPDELACYTEALETLTVRERQHLSAYLNTQVDGRADHGALKDLAAELGTTPEALRTNKSRALKKLKQYTALCLAQRQTGPQAQ